MIWYLLLTFFGGVFCGFTICACLVAGKDK